MQDEIGPPYVTCAVCGNKKQPLGRDSGAVASQGMCGYDCPGYMKSPIPSDLHPGESRLAHGYKAGVGAWPPEERDGDAGD